MENIAADNHHIGFLVGDDAGDLPQKVNLFVFPVVFVKFLTKMPVAGMKYFHNFLKMQRYY